MASNRKLKDPTTLRVFFSSPFGGMEPEREELTKKYFPQFHHACNARGIQFVPVDMRWGITSEAADNAQVINICLRELDRSDVFIGFYGQRYGWHGEDDKLLQQNFDNAIGRYPWLAQYRNRSVTELEFLHGHLNHPGELPAVICFRDKAYDDAVREKALASGDKKNVFKYTSESEHATDHMNDLIRRVKETESKCLAVKVNYKDPIEGAKFMFESVWECCQELLSSSQADKLTPLETDRLCHEAYLSSLTSLYVGGEKYLTESPTEKLKELSTVLVTGGAGSGKSALIANMVKALKQSNQEVIYHFVGSSPATTEPFDILQRLLAELRHLNGTEKKASDDEKKSEENAVYNVNVAFLNELEIASASGKKVFIIIDGLNKVVAYSKTAKHLYWIPEKFPSGICFVASTDSSDKQTLDLLVGQRGYFQLEITPLDPDTQREICQKSLLKNGKELSPPQLERVVEAKETQNALFLKIVVSEISIYGYFRLLDAKIDALIYSDGVKDLLQKVLQRLEEDYNVKDYPGNLVQQVLSSIAVSHEGLTETELLEMFSIPSHVWSPFYFAIESFLISHAGHLRFGFTEMLQAVEESYLNTDKLRLAAQATVSEYFEKIRKNIPMSDGLSTSALERVAKELPWLCQAQGKKEQLQNVLSDVRIFHILTQRHKYELIDFLKFTGLHPDKICDRLLQSFDIAISTVYTQREENLETDAEPPGYQLMPALESMGDIFSTACYYEARIRVLQRKLSILENIEGKINEVHRQNHMMEDRYALTSAYVDNSEYKKAEQMYKVLIEELRSMLKDGGGNLSLKQTLAYSLNGFGLVYLKQKQYELAEPLLQECKEIHETLGNKKSVVESIINLGVVKLDSGQPDVALEYFSEALKMYEQIYFGHLPLSVGNLLTNLALCHRRLDHAEEAKALYWRSLEVKAQAVGYDHEVIAACYMNLGTLEIYFYQNYEKAEEYTRKAIEILELNNAKLEQNEMWQCLENLCGHLMALGKADEAVPIFQRVFAMLKKEGKVPMGNPGLHTKMMNHFFNCEKYEEASDIAACHVAIPDFRQPGLYNLIDDCDSRLPPEERPKRPKEQTLQYAYEELYPGSNQITAYMAMKYVVPSGDMDRLLTMLETMERHNPDFLASTYDVGAQWCELKGNVDGQIRVLKTGIERYPQSVDLKLSLFDVYRKNKMYNLAYPMIQEILSEQPDNPGFTFVAGMVAAMSDDLALCKELWEKVTKMSDEDLALRAKAQLEQLTLSETEQEQGNKEEEEEKDDEKEEEEEEVKKKETPEAAQPELETLPIAFIGGLIAHQAVHPARPLGD